MASRNTYMTSSSRIVKGYTGMTRVSLAVFLAVGLVFALVVFQVGREVAPMISTSQPAVSAPATAQTQQNQVVPQVSTAPGVSAPPPAQSTVSVAKQTQATSAPVKTAAPAPVTKPS